MSTGHFLTHITGERKHKDPFSFKPYARFLYSCNDIPRNYGDRSDAFYRRLIIMRFSKSMSEDQRDLQLFEKLQLEADGILAWAIAGLKRLMENNWVFHETDRTRAEVMNYKVENNNVLAFFRDCCTLEPGAVCLRKELFDEYALYCKDGGLKAVGQPRFNREIAGLACVSEENERVTRRAIFCGIRLAG